MKQVHIESDSQSSDLAMTSLMSDVKWACIESNLDDVNAQVNMDKGMWIQ